MTFIPMKVQENVYKNLLLEGKILKIDGGGNNFVEVIDREFVDGWHLRHNVGRNGGKHIERIPSVFKQALKELREESYVVLSEDCDFSGCCQYHATAYYLKGYVTKASFKHIKEE